MTLRGVFSSCPLLYCVVTVSLYSPSASPAGIRKMSFEGWFRAIMSSVMRVTSPSASVKVMPTEGSSPASLMRCPVSVKLRPAVAVKPDRLVAVSVPPATYMALPFSPTIFTVVASMTSRNSLPCVIAIRILLRAGSKTLFSTVPVNCATALNRPVFTR